jgi:SAM-dependent methyltransferase
MRAPFLPQSRVCREARQGIGDGTNERRQGHHPHGLFCTKGLHVTVQTSIGLPDVQAVYSGPEGDLWELIMGEQIHIGGFSSSMDLAEKAGIGPGMSGVDLCCCNGGGMRFLLRFRQVDHMHGVDATPAVLERAKARCREQGLANKTDFTLADVCNSGLPGGRFDFVWGEDAWCYVVDKAKLIAEAVRLLKPGGIVAFTDWIEGNAGLTEAEAQRFLSFMKFPSILDLAGYRQLLASQGCEVVVAEDTGRFAPCVDLYIKMIESQLTGDALRIISFDSDLLASLSREMTFMQDLAHAGKIIQGLFVARRKT